MSLFVSASVELDPASYGTRLRFSGQHGITLAAQLVVSAPPDLPTRALAMLRKIEKAAARVKAVLNERSKTTPGGLRPILGDLDNGWGALHGRVSSAARLPESIGDTGARARALVEVLFPDGVSFLVNDVETKFAESVRRLDHIEAEGLERELDRIAGAGYLQNVRAAHEALGEAIGAGETPVRFARAELAAAARELSAAIAAYCLQLAAMVDLEDEASVAAFRAAVMPIDKFRAERAASGGGEEDLEDPEEPVTPVPPVPPAAE